MRILRRRSPRVCPRAASRPQLKSGIFQALPFALATASIFAAQGANAGARFEVDDTRRIGIGAGIRTSFTAQEDAAAPRFL